MDIHISQTLIIVMSISMHYFIDNLGCLDKESDVWGTENLIKKIVVNRYENLVIF